LKIYTDVCKVKINSEGAAIRNFFEPRSVAVVGASRNPFKFGSVVVHNLKNLAFPGSLYIINPNAGEAEIHGVPCYPSLKSMPESPEIAVLAVPAQVVPSSVKDCAESGVKNIIIISSGFSEAGPEGQQRLDDILATARVAGIRIIGPNTTGILSPASRFTTTFVPLPVNLRSGPVAFISQTGMFGGIMLNHILTSERFGVSRVAGLGNKCDVDDSDILEYLYDDPATRTVMIYMEGTTRGRRFLKTARWFSAKKPIVLLKGGRSPEGARAAFSHTGSLASSYEIIEDLFRSSGIVLANDMDEMIDYAKVLAYQSPPRGPRVGVVSVSGGAAVMATDVIYETGLTLAPVSSKELGDIQAMLPGWALAGHPMDVEPLMEKVGGNEAYKIALDTVLRSQNVDMGLLIVGLGIFDEAWDVKLVKVLEPVLRNNTKPVAVSLIGPRLHCDLVSGLLEEMNIPAYIGVTRAVKSLAALTAYGSIKKV
jgi:acyl-CoA synthetase (NDP forming)